MNFRLLIASSNSLKLGYSEVTFTFEGAEVQTPAPRIITSFLELRFYQLCYPRKSLPRSYILLIGEQLPLFGKIAAPSSTTSNNPRKVFKSEVSGQLDSEG